MCLLTARQWWDLKMLISAFLFLVILGIFCIHYELTKNNVDEWKPIEDPSTTIGHKTPLGKIL